jgi:hypothetical protein
MNPAPCSLAGHDQRHRLLAVRALVLLVVAENRVVGRQDRAAAVAENGVHALSARTCTMISAPVMDLPAWGCSAWPAGGIRGLRHWVVPGPWAGSGRAPLARSRRKVARSGGPRPPRPRAGHDRAAVRAPESGAEPCSGAAFRKRAPRHGRTMHRVRGGEGVVERSVKRRAATRAARGPPAGSRTRCRHSLTSAPDPGRGAGTAGSDHPLSAQKGDCPLFAVPFT